MSGINFGDPQVLQNFIQAQLKEGKGEIFVGENDCIMYRTSEGSEYIVPSGTVTSFPAVEPVVEPVVEEPVVGSTPKKRGPKTNK